MSITLRVTAKGQITLRKEALRHMGVGPGATVAVELLPGGRVALSAAPKTGSVEDFFGSLAKPGTKPLSLDEIAKLAAEGWAGRR
jgi:antitoxin PrlF